MELFRINIVEKSEPEKPVEQVSYETILAEAMKRLPSVYIVNEKEAVVATDTFNIGDSRTYHMAVKAEKWYQSILEYCFYQSSGYYFYLDTDNLKWSVPEKLVSHYPSGKGVSVTGVNSGVGSLKVTVPVCVMYMPSIGSIADGVSLGKGLLGELGALAGNYLSSVETWDITTLSAEAQLSVAEVKRVETKPEVPQQRKPPYNPFTGIDISKVENPFVDVSPSDWYYEAVMYLYAAGILNGVDFNGQTVYYNADNLFNRGDDGALIGLSLPQTADSLTLSTALAPRYLSGRTVQGIATLSNSNVRFGGSNPESRQYTVLQLYNAHQRIGYKDIPSYSFNPFTDVRSGVNTYQPILWASNNKIVEGYGNNKFGPYDHITREQFCAILVRHARSAGINFKIYYTAKTFTDNADISSWAKNDVVTCQRAGIIQGYPDGSFKPQGDITNAEMSAMIFKYLDQIPR